MLVAATALLVVSLGSCNKDPQDINEEANKATKEAIVKQYLNHTVYPTYASLATEAENLVENLEALKANKTQANVNAAAATFIEARHWWELSEAFLFGAEPLRFGDVDFQPSVRVAATVCTTAAPRPSSRPSCGTATRKAMPAARWRNSGNCQRKTAMRLLSLLMRFDFPL